MKKKMSMKYFIGYLIGGLIGLVSVMNAENGGSAWWLLPCGIGIVVAIVSMILSILKRRQLNAQEQTVEYQDYPEIHDNVRSV